MNSAEFQTILHAWQHRQITETEARQRLHRLKAAPPQGAAEAQAASVEIAVIGMSGQFPAADHVQRFWQNLCAGIDGVAELGEPYLDVHRAFAPGREPGKTYCKWGGILAARDLFDPLFFNLSPRDAESMNPHQRLILQESWKALEDAGYNPKGFRDQPVGVFVGAEPTGYFHETFIGASDAIIASRLSYFLDFKGPALVVNTGCSSSAVAIHLACESLRHGETALALAGGVFATLSEASLISLSQMDMLSPSGRCHPFDHRSDGIVLSEAVGMVALKRLPEALADQDAIYGVICASGMNQDGASNGITAPSGQAQERLISEIYQRFHIDPRQISYVEAHGTGTPLGDPVEVGALTRAFRRFTPDTGYCALGSAKAHIGHPSAAAGVVGLIKILLSMQHRRLPGLLHFDALNPRIALDDSAFYLHKETRDWTVDEGPRMAALNSFGHSGTNVHMVVREALDVTSVRSPEGSRPVLLPLSARTDDSLLQYVARVREALCDPAICLHDLAFTLQTGRMPQAQRLIFLCTDKAQLAQQLNDCLAGHAPPDSWSGRVETENGADVVLPSEVNATCLRELARAWVSGGAIDWMAFNRCHDAGGRRMHAPSYPFAQQSFWIAPARRGAAGGDTPRSDAATLALHPFLARNTSDLRCQRYSTVFDGEAFFFKQHVVAGRRIFPGVCHLEMASAAVSMAASAWTEDRPLVLSNVVWLRPLMIDSAPRQVDIELVLEDDDQIQFTISSRDYDARSGLATGAAVLHSQGLAALTASFAPPSRHVDLAALPANLQGGCLSAAECYQAYRQMTFEHGPAFQGLQSILLGQGEVLAELALPACQQHRFADYLLHPSLMDSALQAAIAFRLDGEGVLSMTQPALPFALERLQVFDRLSERMWARVSVASRDRPENSDGALQKLDIALYDLQGKLCVSMQGFTSRVLADPSGLISTASSTTRLFQPQWQDAPARQDRPALFSQRLILLSGFNENTLEAVRQQLAGPACRCESLASPLQDPADDYQQTALSLLQWIRLWLSQGSGQRQLIQLAVYNPDGERMVAGLAAMLRSLQLEAPHVVCQLIAVDEMATLVDRLEENAGAQAVDIRYVAQRRQIKAWHACPEVDLAVSMPWKAGGVYLITGGLGGLGRIFAGAITAAVSHCTVILTGRAKLDPRLLAPIDAGRSTILYRQLDVSDREAVRQFVEAMVAEYGRLDGVLHCAGMIRDSLLINKQDDDLQQVLAAKVAGARNIDLATATLPLEFLIFFSSGTGALGNVGQADYAAANAFIDDYAAYRSALTKLGLRHGHSLAIAWPLWKGGGMRVEEATQQQMAQQTGMVAMPSNAGIYALYQAIALAAPHVMVMHGDGARIAALLAGGDRVDVPVLDDKASGTRSVAAPPAAHGGWRRVLTDLVSVQRKIPLSEIHPDTAFSQYGFDSISLTALAGLLKQQWRLNLAPTRFFEYPTIARLASYLEHEHGGVLTTGLLRPAVSAPLSAESTGPVSHRVGGRRRSEAAARVDREGEPDDIAVIGVSGRFPMADDVTAFFCNLKDGRDGIRVIPPDRWDWREYDGDPHQQPDKTNVKWGGFINGVDHFDPLFFAISPREAQLMDPQQRLLMTYVWLAIEDAGYAVAALAGSDTGIFVGTGVTGYSSLIAKTGVPIEGFSTTAMVPSVGPNRMSFLLDLHGPSEPVETACSSSLVAIHRAVEAIQHGDCQMAIAGGVNTLIAPEAQISFSKAGMLALDGRSKTFSAQADGYARGEGVGMIVLKKRAQAEADGDVIYALIRSTAENHGGKANSLTAPNPRAQAELLKSAYRKAGVDPRSIGYIEAHGTGTPLGDPIEINGLKMAFSELADEMGIGALGPGYCGVGSVKSNVGHLELAAGIAGVIKVLLQLKHKMLFKSLHCEVLNPHIALTGSPFYIVQQSQPWEAIRDSQGRPLPRRAGVSAFGFGGANAHVLLEEYQALPRQKSVAPGVRMVPLSAKTPQRLAEYARRLAAFLVSPPEEAEQDALRYLDDLAYTLQVGREAMEERLLLLCESLDDLQAQLVAFATSGEAMYRGRSETASEVLSLLGEDEDMTAALSSWMDKGKYHPLAALWCRGVAIDWPSFYRGRSMQRLSLPGYPFAEERYWVTDLATVRAANPVSAGAWLHPMLERNTSDFYVQRFSSRWSAQESWFADHKIDGHGTMPGVAYLEMARAAIAQSWPSAPQGERPLQFSNIIWLTPYVPTPQRDALHIELVLAQETITFRIYSEADGEEAVHCQGRAERASLAGIAPLDLALLRAEPWRRDVAEDELYACFERLGIHYGPGHRGVKQLWLGEGRLLAKLMLSAEMFDGDWVLHPGMLDSALQASLGLLLSQQEGLDEVRLPFALAQLCVLDRCQPVMWALIHVDRQSQDNAVQRIDIDLCDEQGQIVISLRSLSARPVTQREEAVAYPLLPAGLTLLSPQWRVATCAALSPPPLATLVIGATDAQCDGLTRWYAQLECLPGQAGSEEEMLAQLSACAPFERLVWLAPPPLEGLTDQRALDRRDQGVLGLFRLMKALLRLRDRSSRLEMHCLFTSSIALHRQAPLAPELAACHGLAGVFARENTHWTVRLFDLPVEVSSWPVTLPTSALPGECLAWREGEWFCQRLLPLAQGVPLPAEMAYRQEGVYLVIGGAGGIGEVWTRHMMRRCRARVIWLGRRAANEGIHAKLAALAEWGQAYGAPAPIYIQADASNVDALARARQQIVETYGPIHGLVHSALVLDDACLMQMDEARFMAALDAKMATSVHMAQVFNPAHHPALDFVLFFSSMVAFSRAAGQGNYAAACTFVDAFATQLSQYWSCQVKVINWGYWGSVGVVADAAYRARMAEQGLDSIEPEEGMLALERLLASPHPQLGLIKLLKPMDIPGIDLNLQVAAYLGEEETVASDWAQVAQIVGPAPQHSPAAAEVTQWLLAYVFACLDELAGSQPLTEQYIAPPECYRRWLQESLRWLVEHQQIDAEGQRLAPVPEVSALWSQWAEKSQVWGRDGDLRALLQLLETCARALPAILRGTLSAVEVMFPGGAMTLVEDVYKNNRIADYFNAVLCEVVVDRVRRGFDAGQTLRILEVGAGTGGTTAGLIDQLQPWHACIAEYCYTDVSQAFLHHAQQHFAPRAPYLRTAIFDVSQPCAAQGIDTDHYDLLIATNVLHALPNLRDALCHAKAALRRGGLLLLNEISQRSLWTHLTFGLLEGWWQHEDSVLRMEGCPGLPPEGWRRLLRLQGFDPVTFPVMDSHPLGQQIIVAASDGVVCLPVRLTDEALTATVTPLVHNVAVADEHDLTGQCRQWLTHLLSKWVNIPAERLQSDVSFDRYGVDSILQISLIQSIEAVAGELARTLLFEYNTIDQLTDYLLAEHHVALVKHFATPTRVSNPPPKAHANPRSSSPRVAPARVDTRDACRDIAIIGMAGRYPMAEDLDHFWDNLRTGRNCIGVAPRQRWATSLTRAQPWAAQAYYGGFLAQLEGFDHGLFGLSSEEAAQLSPELQQMLEVSWLAFEDAGYHRDAIARFQQRHPVGVGVFIGSMYHQSPWTEPSLERAAIKSNVTDWQIPNRISHYFDLKGPSLAVNTACASAMTAIHLACQSLLQKDCALALAGGVNLILDPSKYQTLKLANVLGSGDLCHGFGQGDGMLPGEGAGVVLLKPLAAALEDGDRIHGVIKSASVNHGGGKLKYSAPDTQQQARLMADAIQKAGVTPAQIHYVEAAANGSELGDAIEVAALKKVFGDTEPACCALGTVKSNIGHLEAASGISQLTKVLLQLKHGQLAPVINAEPPNPHLRLAGSAFYLQSQCAPWPLPVDAAGHRQPRRCLINSFGAGGSYASLVVEEHLAAPIVQRPPSGAPSLLVFAAASRHSLLAYLARFQAFVSAHPQLDLADVADSLLLRETRLPHRAAMVAGSLQSVLATLSSWLAADSLSANAWMSAVDGIDDSDRGYAMGSLAQIAEAYCKGAELNAATWSTPGARRVSLPGYVFEHGEAPPSAIVEGSLTPFDSLLYQRIVRGELDVAQFEQMITTI